MVGQSSNTQACIAFCQVIKQSGYVPVFYSYSGMNQLWNYEAIYQVTGAHFWLAAYPHMGVPFQNLTTIIFQAFQHIPTLGSILITFLAGVSMVQ